MNCNGNCPYTRPYYGPPWPNGFGSPIPTIQPHATEDPVEFLKRAKKTLKDFEELMKSDKKEDPKKKKETFTFLETAGLLMVGGLFVGILQMKILQYFATNLHMFTPQ